MRRLKTMGLALAFVALGSSTAFADLDCGAPMPTGDGHTTKYCRTPDGDDLCFRCDGNGQNCNSC